MCCCLFTLLTLLTRRLTFLKFDVEQLTTMLGTIEILSTACQALPTKLPMLNNIAGFVVLLLLITLLNVLSPPRGFAGRSNRKDSTSRPPSRKDITK